jgi:hypothetical protein
MEQPDQAAPRPDQGAVEAESPVEDTALLERGKRSIPLRYEPNPKHKPVPTPGRHGAICPPDVDAQALLEASEQHDGKRFATNGVDAFCAHCHRPEENCWHGFPIPWEDVPPKLRSRWIEEGIVSRRTIRRDRRRRS